MQKSRSYTMLEDDSDDDDDDDDDELVVDSIVAWLVRSLLPGGTRKPVLGDRWLTGRTGADLGRGGRDGSRRGGREIVRRTVVIGPPGETSQPTQGLHDIFVRGPSVGNKATDN